MAKKAASFRLVVVFGVGRKPRDVKLNWFMVDSRVLFLIKMAKAAISFNIEVIIVFAPRQEQFDLSLSREQCHALFRWKYC